MRGRRRGGRGTRRQSLVASDHGDKIGGNGAVFIDVTNVNLEAGTAGAKEVVDVAV